MKRILNNKGRRNCVRHGLWWKALAFCLAVPHFSFAAAPEPVRKAALTAVAAAVCAGTYKGGTGEENQYLRDYGWQLTPYEEDKEGTQVHFTLLRRPESVNGEHLAMLAFRGSASKADWRLNLRTKPVPFTEEQAPSSKKPEEAVPQVHKGFLSYAKAALATPVDLDGDGQADDVAAFLQQHPHWKLLLTGHSLGGAGATLYGELLARQGVRKEQIPIVTFGAPAVGNEAFGQTYGPNVELHRVVTSLDPVPGALQTFYKGYGYRQFGEEKKYKLSGKYTDYQHPISYYLDLAVLDYYRERDKAVAEGLMKPRPREKQGRGPLVALAVYYQDNGADTRFSPDLGRLTLDEYRNWLPHYKILAYEHINLTGDDLNGATLEKLKQQGREAGAEYLLVLAGERRRVGRTDKWYLHASQGLFNLRGRRTPLLTEQSTRIRFEQGFVQSTLALLARQKETLQQHLPGLTGVNPFWTQMREEGEQYENH